MKVFFLTKPYGKKSLLERFDSVLNITGKILIVSGGAGIGKRVVMRELGQPLVE
ncbi:protein of unknown function [Pseudodesulfovibrio piezophilus C1TLV30]|uniref:Uncharacterized protein n=1 Tax=Pseudodesulfovibrio piezophilus (strain DSM 21447 / JCM 15486 / C1TLV30) TaxID=1322246 RepID=M1WUR8_PSEP2|nr:protein of unknown function [Pseudodesulfovibrio piezophilus C1TLV30]